MTNSSLRDAYPGTSNRAFLPQSTGFFDGLSNALGVRTNLNRSRSVGRRDRSAGRDTRASSRETNTGGRKTREQKPGGPPDGDGEVRDEDIGGLDKRSVHDWANTAAQLTRDSYRSRFPPSTQADIPISAYGLPSGRFHPGAGYGQGYGLNIQPGGNVVAPVRIVDAAIPPLMSGGLTTNRPIGYGGGYLPGGGTIPLSTNPQNPTVPYSAGQNVQQGNRGIYPSGVRPLIPLQQGGGTTAAVGGSGLNPPQPPPNPPIDLLNQTVRSLGPARPGGQDQSRVSQMVLPPGANPQPPLQQGIYQHPGIQPGHYQPLVPPPLVPTPPALNGGFMVQNPLFPAPLRTQAATRPSPLVDTILRQSTGYYQVNPNAAYQHPAKRKVPDLPTFSGRNDKMSWESFIKRFMQTQRIYGLCSPQDDLDMMRDLENHIDDLALEAYLSVIQSCGSFIQLAEQIEMRIATREDPSAAAQKIMMIVKISKEGWMEFSMKLQHLFVTAYPGISPEIIQTMAGEKFFTCFPAAWMEKAWISETPHDLSTLVQFAKRCEMEDEYRKQSVEREKMTLEAAKRAEEATSDPKDSKASKGGNRDN